MAAIPQPPYSPDLAPFYICLFPKIKLNLRGNRFVTIEEIQAESSRVHDTLTEKNFQEAFRKWKRRWDWCLHVEGNYFEGDGGRQALL
jgi:transposase